MSEEDRAALAVMAVSRCLNALGLLAAPMTWELSSLVTNEGSLRRGIIGSIEEALDAIETFEGQMELVTGCVTARCTTLLEELRASTEGWVEGPPPPRLVDLSRECLSALGMPEPEDGWEAFALDGE